jgi:VCBS repeat-containing protein
MEIKRAPAGKAAQAVASNSAASRKVSPDDDRQPQGRTAHADDHDIHAGGPPVASRPEDDRPSFGKTPQAVADAYSWTEDQLLLPGVLSGNVLSLDVLSDDRGGGGKRLFSIDDGAGSYLQDLLTSNVNSGWEATANGNRIRIHDGRIELDITGYLSSIGAASVNAMAATDTLHDSFVYAIRLGDGTLSWARVTVDIRGLNDRPVAMVDVGVAGENEVRSFDVLANDTDADVHASKTLVSLGTVTVTSANGAVHGIDASGAFSIVAGQVRFVPGTLFDALDHDDTATVTVRYTMKDDQAATSSSTLTLTVKGANDGPVAVADSGAAGENEVRSFDVLANDTDVDVGATRSLVSLGTVTVTSANGAVHGIDASGAFAIVGGQVRFAPGTLFDALGQGDGATVTVVYTMQDDQGATSSATMTLAVSGANDGPVATASLVATNQDRAIVGTLGARDPDAGDSLAFRLVSGPAHGTLELDAQGHYVYTPASGYSGGDGFTYRVDDGHGGTATAQASIDVAPTPGVPQLTYALADAPADTVVSTPLADNRVPPEVAALAGGGHVVVWSATANGADTEGFGVYLQRYDPAGAKIGLPQLVNTTTTDDQVYASVAATGTGFVVTWSSVPPNAAAVVLAQRYDASGARLGGEVLVSQSTDGDQIESNVDGLVNGGYVITWNGYDAATGSTEIYARIYDANGVAAPGGALLVNSVTTEWQFTEGFATESVAGLAGGGFVVTWRDESGAYDPSGSGILARLFDSTGTAVTEAFRVNATVANDQSLASVGAVGTGFVVTWTSSGQDGSGSGIYAQQFDAAGVAVGAEFRVNSWTSNDQAASKLVELPDGGFVVSWMSMGVGGANAWQVAGQRYDAGGHAVGTEFIVSAVDGGSNTFPSMTLRGDGALVVAWRADGGQTVEQRIIESFATHATPPGGPAADAVVSVPLGDNHFPPEVAALADGGHVVVWSASLNGGDGDGYGVYQQRYDSAGAKVGGPQLVNSTTAGDQVHASVAANGTGFVVTWTSTGQDGSGSGVYARRFDAAGDPVGGEVLVNQATAGDQAESSVGALAGGGYAISWNGYDASTGTNEIYARVYDAAGVASPAGAFVVNPVTSDWQYTDGHASSNVAGLSDGSFVVTWRDYSGAYDPSGAGIVARIFDAGGAAMTDAFRVNTTTAHDQVLASVGAVGSGFVVTWTSDGQDGGGDGIYAQRFDAAGTAVGTEFQVNSWTSNDQIAPRVVGLSDGGFVISWMSMGVGGPGAWQVSGQRYDIDGHAVDGEFIVNAVNGDNNTYPSMALRGDGALVVAWHDATGQTIEQKIVTSFETGSAAAKTLVGGDGNDSLVGSGTADHLDGAAGDDRLEGLGGNDQLAGGAGNDTFVFASIFGHDTIGDFRVGHDVLELRGLFPDVAAVLGATADNPAGDAVITAGGGTITLVGVHTADLQAHPESIHLA